MRTAISRFVLLEPRSLIEALRMMRKEQPMLHKERHVIPIAGCTDVYVSLNFGTLSSTKFLNLWNLDSLRTIEIRKEHLVIGALATYTQIIHDPRINKWFPMLVAASRVIGGMQIQNRGTLGGNVANASPAGDTLPVLAVADAVVILSSLDEVRRVPFNEFYTGYRKTVMRPDELITALEIPPITGKQWFRKVGTRQAQAISKVVMAATGGKQPRIAMGSVGPTVLRLRKTEAVLAAGGSADEAVLSLLEETSPIDDLRSTRDYRRRVSANLLTAWVAQDR